MGSVKCGMWNVKWGVGMGIEEYIKCGVWSVKCGLCGLERRR